MKNNTMPKLKKYTIVLAPCQEYDEFEVEAKNIKEAKKKAEKIMDKEYNDMEIIDIEESK